jgi:hypothetical protein
LIRQEFGADVETVAGNFGVFKIWVDGQLAFDKYTANGWIGRFGFGAVPPDAIVIEAIKKHIEERSATPTGAVK